VDDVDTEGAAHVDGDEVPEVDDYSACKELEGKFDAVIEILEVVDDAQRVDDGDGCQEAQDMVIDFWDGDEPGCRDDGDKDVPAYSRCGGAMDFPDAGLVDSALFDGVLDSEWGDCEYSQQHCDTKGQNHNAKIGGVLSVLVVYGSMQGLNELKKGDERVILGKKGEDFIEKVRMNWASGVYNDGAVSLSYGIQIGWKGLRALELGLCPHAREPGGLRGWNALPLVGGGRFGFGPIEEDVGAE
jgi:hypothetical protein